MYTLFLHSNCGGGCPTRTAVISVTCVYQQRPLCSVQATPISVENFLPSNPNNPLSIKLAKNSHRGERRIFKFDKSSSTLEVQIRCYTEALVYTGVILMLLIMLGLF